MSATSDPPLCPDWVFANNCDTHVAKDRGWFKTYTPFTSTLHGQPVLGIGTVELPTKRSPKLSGVAAHGTLYLNEVLHVPSFICNIIGDPILISDGYGLTTHWGEKSHGNITDKQGKCVAYFDPKKKFFTVKLRGPPAGPEVGPSPFKEGVAYMLSSRWDPAERQKWQKFKNQNEPNASKSSPAGTEHDNPPYTADEKEFLKRHWGNEYRFLVQFGLSIYKEEDRAEGRSILRAHREDLTFQDESDEGTEDDDEFDLQGRQADYNFSERQMDWIDEHFGNSEKFMLSYGLKWYNNDDVEEAKAIADAMIDQDEEDSA